MEAERKVLERVLKHMRKTRSDGGAKKSSINGDGVNQWLAMKLKTDGYDASLCQTSWVTSLGCPAGGVSLFNPYIYVHTHIYIYHVCSIPLYFKSTYGFLMQIFVC